MYVYNKEKKSEHKLKLHIKGKKYQKPDLQSATECCNMIIFIGYQTECVPEPVCM
jgi:hypothetical protein